MSEQLGSGRGAELVLRAGIVVCGAQRIAIGSLGLVAIVFSDWPSEMFFELNHPTITSICLGVILILLPHRVARWTSIGRSRLLSDSSAYCAAALAWIGIDHASHHGLHLPHLYYSKDPLHELAGPVAGFLIGTLLFFAAVPLARLWERCAGIAAAPPAVPPPVR